MIIFSKKLNNQPNLSEKETKYVFPNTRAFAIIQFLKLTCLKDGRYPESTVSSIYYDTKDWTYLSEKINSDYLKTKVRIRWYSDMCDQDISDYSFVEAKYKTGSQRKKIRVETQTSGKWLNTVGLEDSRLRQLPDVLRAKGIMLKKNLHPILHIRYKRQRFVDPYSDSRICLDYDISAPRVNGYMLPKVNPFALNTAVFEMKGHIRDIPVSLKPLLLLGCRKSSFSKYQACYQKVMGIMF